MAEKSKSSYPAAGPLILMAALMALVFAPKLADTAPAPEIPYAHHGKKQCGRFWMGDEFYVCSLPAGWVKSVKCPSGYVDIQRIPGENCRSTGWNPFQPQQQEPPSSPEASPSRPAPPIVKQQSQSGFGCSNY